VRKVIHVNGGLGRVICAEPAIRELSIKEGVAPIVVTSWPEVFWNNEHVHKVYREEHEWLFDDVIKNNDYVQPEPYHHRPYYSQKQHLSCAFKQLLGLKPKLSRPMIVLTNQERLWAKGFVDNIRETTGRKVIAFQPFGAGFDGMSDNTNRSLSMEQAHYVASNCIHMMVNCTKGNLNHANVWHREFSLRELFAVVSECDAVFGVDSSVSHIGAAFGKTGVLMLGGTHPTNVGWDNYRMANRDGFPKTIFANRFHGFIDQNKGAMDFSNEELDTLIKCMNESQYFEV